MAAAQRLVRRRLTVGAAGDIDAETLAGVFDLAFGDLPDEAKEIGSFAGQELHVPMDIPQTELVFGLPGIARDDTDFFPAFVLNSVLGGGTPATRLEREVRGKTRPRLQHLHVLGRREARPSPDRCHLDPR